MKLCGIYNKINIRIQFMDLRGTYQRNIRRPFEEIFNY